MIVDYDDIKGCCSDWSGTCALCPDVCSACSVVVGHIKVAITDDDYIFIAYDDIRLCAPRDDYKRMIHLFIPEHEEQEQVLMHVRMELDGIRGWWYNVRG